jgi:hypothetical protein
LEVEDLLHIFWHCPVVSNFWAKVQEWSLPVLQDFVISPQTVKLYGLGDRCNKIYNLMTLLGKVLTLKKSENKYVSIGFFQY